MKNACFRAPPLAGVKKMTPAREAGNAGLFFLFLGFLLLGAAIFWGGKITTALPKKTSISALEVVTIPQSRVFLNEKNLGMTPLENNTLPPGEYTLRILPENKASFSSWERKIKLNPGLLTYVNYLFAATEEESTGEILTLEKIDQEKGEIVALSDPDGATIVLDGQDQGITPKVLSGFLNGDHEISFSKTGYQTRSFTIKTWQQHKILVNVKLPVQRKEPLSTSTQDITDMVEILETPTGWLRVRFDPSLSSTEASRVKPGEKYPLLEEKEGWFKIEYEESKAGWVASPYAQKTSTVSSQIRR